MGEKTEKSSQIFKEYFKEIRKRFITQDYTEGTLRTPFENFIGSLNNRYRLHQEPKRKQKLGAPDFVAYNMFRKIGYIETKDLNVNLDVELESEQIKKYKESINNIVLTNYSRFILIRNNQPILDVKLFSLPDLNDARFAISKEKAEELLELLETFFDYKLPTIKSARELSRELSKKAKLLKNLALEQLEEDISKAEKNESTSSLYDFYVGLKELIKDTALEDVADAYAQTITYGLFLAKLNSKEDTLRRETASSYIPKTIGVIKKIFLNISGDSIPPNISWIVEELLEILNATEKEKILSQIDFRGKKDKDPFTFFYEDFLSNYEPEKRKHLGVYYTPRPVINFIVNSVNLILKNEFNKMRGFAEDDVTILDPAVGTGTFLWLAYLLTLNELIDAGLRGIMKKKIENHILKDFYGIEILITPYIIAHLKLAMVLRKWGYELKDDERIPVYLSNTLEPTEEHGLLPFLRELTEESRIANELKIKKPILVIIGNPPYAGMSANKGKWITDLVKKGYTRADGTKDDGYYRVDGKPLGEKNPKWLLDDYVKFIRFGQWKIDKTGEGVLGFITNHSYLDNPTFRGMRESLVKSFDRIYILNLHGNSLKKETCPDGSPDKNVFDIKQGVAIAIFVKNRKFKDKKVFYKDLYGKREYKYAWLDKNSKNLYDLEWKELKPKSPYYFFIPVDVSLQDEYERHWKITDIFPVSSVGIVTARDKLTIKWTSEEIWETVSTFSKLDTETARERYNLGKDVRDWKVELAQKDLIDSGLDKERIMPILYRPFDTRYTYYTGKSRGFHCMPRPEVMRHMMQENLGLITPKQFKEEPGAFVTQQIAAHKTVSAYDINYLFPLYLYPDTSKKKLLSYTTEESERQTNISPEIFKFLSETYGEEVTPEEIFYYIYAVLYSNTYRTRYAEFLKIDFPRIPFVKDYETFQKLSEIGKELVDLHLMKNRLQTTTKFDVEGSNVVKNVKYKEGKVYINKGQYFDGVPEDVWSFYIGGYQVLDKWLKSRKNRELTSGEIEHFMQVVEVIKETITIMERIDNIDFLAQV
jgi:type I restriction-modification system DNA methylase subunit